MTTETILLIDDDRAYFHINIYGRGRTIERHTEREDSFKSINFLLVKIIYVDVNSNAICRLTF